ncbi:MAG: hypothetical protein ABW116_04870 [Candidatus Sedimenticola sp. 20ELBAFRAG]
MKLLTSLISLFIYVVLFFGVYYIHIAYFTVDVVFYSTLVDSIIAVVILTALFLLTGYFNAISGFEKSLVVVICLLSGYAISISVPTVIDRSLSFYILEKIQQRGGGIKLSRFEEVFTREYAREHRLVDVRLTEQQKSGTITIDNDCVKLTGRGHLLADFSRYFRQNLLPKQRLLMGEYTDDLTNPFSDSKQTIDYACQ